MSERFGWGFWRIRFLGKRVHPMIMFLILGVFVCDGEKVFFILAIQKVKAP